MSGFSEGVEQAVRIAKQYGALPLNGIDVATVRFIADCRQSAMEAALCAIAEPPPTSRIEELRILEDTALGDVLATVAAWARARGTPATQMWGDELFATWASYQATVTERQQELQKLADATSKQCAEAIARMAREP